MSLSKERILRISLSFLLLVILLCTGLLPPAAASDSAPVDLGTVELTGRLKGGTFELDPPQMDQLFAMDGGLYPGGSWKQTVHVKNTCNRPMDISIISVTNNAAESSLFDALTTSIVVDGKEVYDGSYGGGTEESPMTKAFRIDGRETLDFEIVAHLDAAATNELQGKPLDSTWLFGALYHYPLSSEYSSYAVYYVDEEGRALHEKKEANARIGSTVTEQAVEIEGYTPDTEEKRIIIQRNPKKNEIKFIYSSVSAGDSSGTVSPDAPAEPSERPSGVKTGVEMEDRCQDHVMVLLVALCLLIVMSGYIFWKVHLIRRKQNVDSTREEDQT